MRAYWITAGPSATALIQPLGITRRYGSSRPNYANSNGKEGSQHPGHRNSCVPGLRSADRLNTLQKLQSGQFHTFIGLSAMTVRISANSVRSE
jgi:hypothetical protein